MINYSNMVVALYVFTDHVISAILHVDHEYDDPEEPWPLVIEGFDGETAALDLGTSVFVASH